MNIFITIILLVDLIKDKLKALGIEFIIKKTSEAVNEYNKIYKDKRVVCALHLTC